MPSPVQQEPRRKVLIVNNQFGVSRKQVVWAIVAAVISMGAHALLIVLVLNLKPADAQAEEDGKVKAVPMMDDADSKPPVAQEAKKDPDRGQEVQIDLTNPDVGNDPNKRSGDDAAELSDINVPLPPMPDATPGFKDPTLDNTPRDIAPTPGTVPGYGTAGVPSDLGTGMPSMPGIAPGGFNGAAFTNGFAGRGNGAAKQRLLESGGGNKESEARVARGLVFLADHQSKDGRWSMTDFNRDAHKTITVQGVQKTVYAEDKSTPEGNGRRPDDVAGTSFGLLPFLAAGHTHLPVPGAAIDYHKGVDNGLKWLMRSQSAHKDGNFGGDTLYSHALATITMCEAYGLTSDPALKLSAQRALNFIEFAQSEGGGWRYRPKNAGDLSVTGWMVMALKSGQMAGLSVNPAVLKKAEKFLDSCEVTSRGSYYYTPGTGERISMTAVGLLCRQYLGVTPRNEGLLLGVEKLEKSPANRNMDIYYVYYATQVMHHMGGTSWEKWNLGATGDGKGGIRDLLISMQDEGKSNPDNAGSWMFHGHANGRLMSTSMALIDAGSLLSSSPALSPRRRHGEGREVRLAATRSLRSGARELLGHL